VELVSELSVASAALRPAAEQSLTVRQTHGHALIILMVQSESLEVQSVCTTQFKMNTQIIPLHSAHTQA